MQHVERGGERIAEREATMDERERAVFKTRRWHTLDAVVTETHRARMQTNFRKLGCHTASVGWCMWVGVCTRVCLCTLAFSPPRHGPSLKKMCQSCR